MAACEAFTDGLPGWGRTPPSGSAQAAWCAIRTNRAPVSDGDTGRIACCGTSALVCRYAASGQAPGACDYEASRPSWTGAGSPMCGILAGASAGDRVKGSRQTQPFAAAMASRPPRRLREVRVDRQPTDCWKEPLAVLFQPLVDHVCTERQSPFCPSGERDKS